MLVKAVLATFAKGAFSSVVEPYVSDVKDAAVQAARDTIISKASGKLTLDEWASIIVKCADMVKEKAQEEDGLTYVGGKLKFAALPQKTECISASFQLYFLDEQEKWQKIEASRELPSDKFTPETLSDICSGGEIVFDVE